jgi:hypothetical protein
MRTAFSDEFLSYNLVRDRSVRVGPKTTLRAGRQKRRSLVSEGKIIFLFPKEFTSALWPTRPATQWASIAVSMDTRSSSVTRTRGALTPLSYLLSFTVLIYEYLSIYVLILLLGSGRVTKTGKLKRGGGGTYNDCEDLLLFIRNYI